MAQYKVEHLGKYINTTGNETSPLQVGDTVLAYATMPADTKGSGAFGVRHQTTQLQQARIARNGKLARPKPNRWGFNNKKDHTGNLALDPQNHDAYFTRADVGTLRAEIWYAKRLRRHWDKPHRLLGPVNLHQYTSTHPTVGRIDDTTAILYFVSDRPGGIGGTDIWYSIVRNGIAETPVNLGPQVNSTNDEYTPFYDQTNGVLYFSSDRPGGMGGFDIYCAVGARNTWQHAEAVCNCLNSPQNDLYFTIATHDFDTGLPTSGYLASNRPDSYFIHDTMCCNDLYRWSLDTALLVQRIDTLPPTIAQADTPPSLASQIKHFFPLFLYFHNDQPDPRSHDTATNTNYADCQRSYANLRQQYIGKQTTAADSAEMQRFFDSCVVGNYERLNLLCDYIEEQLDEGHSIRLTVSGYASPLARASYNYNLSQRRIASFANLLRNWRGGLFGEALDTGRLLIVQDPHGAVPPTSASQAADPIFSLPAAQARRIEVSRCEVF